MATSKAYAAVKASIEEQFLTSSTAETPSDVYFELAAIIAARGISIDRDTTISPDLIDKAEKAARATVAYTLGSTAHLLDSGKGERTELENLMNQVRGY